MGAYVWVHSGCKNVKLVTRSGCMSMGVQWMQTCLVGYKKWVHKYGCTVDACVGARGCTSVGLVTRSGW